MVLAARGARNLGTGETPVEDEAERVGGRRRAWTIHIESILLAAALTGVFLLIH